MQHCCTTDHHTRLQRDKAIVKIRATLVRKTPKPRQTDATPFNAEMTTFINNTVREFQAQTVADTRSHIHDALNEMHRTLPILVSSAVSTATLIQTAHGTSHPEPDSPRQNYLVSLYQVIPPRLVTVHISHPHWSIRDVHRIF